MNRGAINFTEAKAVHGYARPGDPEYLGRAEWFRNVAAGARYCCIDRDCDEATFVTGLPAVMTWLRSLGATSFNVTVCEDWDGEFTEEP